MNKERSLKDFEEVLQEVVATYKPNPYSNERLESRMEVIHKLLLVQKTVCCFMLMDKDFQAAFDGAWDKAMALGKSPEELEYSKVAA
jgi:hypothetical protein